MSAFPEVFRMTAADLKAWEVAVNQGLDRDLCLDSLVKTGTCL